MQQAPGGTSPLRAAGAVTYPLPARPRFTLRQKSPFRATSLLPSLRMWAFIALVDALANRVTRAKPSALFWRPSPPALAHAARLDATRMVWTLRLLSPAPICRRGNALRLNIAHARHGTPDPRRLLSLFGGHPFPQRMGAPGRAKNDRIARRLGLPVPDPAQG